MTHFIDYGGSKGNIFITHSVASENVFSLARRLAKYPVPVLISGETGTGKECVARYIHDNAYAHDAPYVGVNCAAIPENLLEAMLFGYEKGAFTGAVTSLPGKFEQANGGTLLLDEIGDMSPAMQAKLLRVLQEQEVERLGSRQCLPLNIRLIAATNKDLQREVDAGRFRQDLFYRIAVVPIHIPPLRSRPQDILPIARFLLNKYQSCFLRRVSLSDEACRALLNHDWPGNIRELENVVKRGVILADGDEINAADLGLPTPHSQAKPGETMISDVRRHGRNAEYDYISEVLRQHQGNKTKTAAVLGITPRALRYRLASMREKDSDTSGR